MIRESNANQKTLSEFDWPFQNEPDPQNRWVTLAQRIPWDVLSQCYHQAMDERKGRPALKARVVIGALIIQHKLVLSDQETISLIQVSPYMQYLNGMKSYSSEKPFDPSLFVTIRRRKSAQMFEEFTQSITDELKPRRSRHQVEAKAPDKQCDKDNDDNDQPPANGGSKVEESSQKGEPPEHQPHQSKLIVDATIADQATCSSVVSMASDSNNGAGEQSPTLFTTWHISVTSAEP